MIPSFLLYLGLAVLLLGAISLVKPILQALKMRRKGVLAAALGLLLAIVALLLPSSLTRVEHRSARLDDFVPEYQFNEVHSLHVDASRERVFQAVREVTADEIRLFRTLAWIRAPHFGNTEEDILHAPPRVPVLDVALRSGFLVLADDAPREVVIGTSVAGERLPSDPLAFAAFSPPRTVKAAMNFLVVDSDGERGSGCTLRTETRVFATDASARRAFAVYWRFIHPGSALIRRGWLAAIKKRAEVE